jgi:hypothetical protein
VARLEQRPPAADPNAVNQRLDQLEKRIAGVSSPDPRAVEARLTALEARGAAAGQATPSAAAPAEPNLAPVLARLDALEKTVAREPIKVDAVEAKVDALSARDPNADLRGRVDDVTRQLDDLKASTSKQTREANHADRLAGLDIALASGHPLGAIPNAPPALTRFATVAPPTEAALRLSFPAAAREALKVSRPDTEGKPFLDRVMARLQDFKLITVREGDRVLIGNAAGATLGHAQVLLEAGDLAGAARTVATLTGPPAEKMAAWLADANALVAAREALATLAGNG